MQCIFIPIFLSVLTVCSASFSGPFLLWGHEKVLNLQPRALVEATEQDFATLFREAKAIVVFVRNTTGRLDGNGYPKFQAVVKNNAWAYLPQRSLVADPFNYNANIEVIELSGTSAEDDTELLAGYGDALTIYGDGEVLGILANREDDSHFISKREAKENEDDRTTTAQPATEETEESFIYVADGNKAILYVNSAPVLTLAHVKEPIKLTVHNKAITFDDQRTKGFGRLNIIFTVEGEKLFVRFNYTLTHGTWAAKAVEVEYKDYKSVLPIVGGIYEVASAPLGFSYRCSARQMIYKNSNDSLVLTDYQVQPWLNGASKFGNVYDCIGFITAPIWAGILVTAFLCGILAVGLIFLMDIKTPNRFESSRNKQLTFAVQE